MADPAAAWPLTSEARDHLVGELARLRADVAGMAGEGLEEGVLRLPIAMAARRLEILTGVLERSLVVDDLACAAIGRRTIVRDADGVAMTFRIVLPGDGDPDMGWISADSPLGSAVLGASAGDVVEVPAPAGRWWVTVVAVD